ncbi:MAG: hypothetical protein F4Z04_06180 [Acidobacteria bacterium]|nr:hypothetical protein [Acidobacteriota bacterium]
MSRGTRYVVFGGGGLVVAGLAVGLVAWLGGGLPALAQGHPDELRYLPADAAIISFANVRDVMNSDLRERLREREPDDGGVAALEDWSGIDLDTDIDRVAAALVPSGRDGTDGIIVLVGRFDADRIESIAIARGGISIDHAGRPLILLETDRDNPVGEDAALAFIEPGVVAIGSETLVRQALDEEAGADTNPRLMGLLEHVDEGSTAWTVGSIDDLQDAAVVPEQLASQMSQVSAFALGGQVNGGVRGRLTAEATDEETGRNLRDLVQGFLALGRLQAAERPELAALLNALQLSSDGANVMLSFDLPADALLDLLPGQDAPAPGAP